jgi:hypothetical protein
MKFKSALSRLLPNSVLRWRDASKDIGGMVFDADSSIHEDIKSKYNFDEELLDFYAGNEGRTVHKWHHYIPLYDQYFSRFRASPVRFLEIGVFRGGSLQMWRKYFGENAIIYGIDSDSECAKLNGLSAQVRIGSQDDPEFLRQVVDEMGGIDVILDDGSHQAKHQIKSFKYLFPRMNRGGVYMVEDLHTSFWRGYGGGYGRQSNFFGFSSDLINDMHHWWHFNRLKHPTLKDMCSGVHIHDSIAVFDKGAVYEPTHSMVP